ncbi:MAG: hypothetical protein EPO23_06740 [Xanthobacteraceae bacterium]|nr:MAG: hypothetical protein EPO23_06740 [Xanthobacteraceae bacterium]
MRTPTKSATPLVAAVLLAAAITPMRADTVPPFKGNDTGGIIAYGVFPPEQARDMAAAHCASYGKAARLLAVQAEYGGYISFACFWVPPRPQAISVLD